MLVPRSKACVEASLDRWEAWLVELDDHPLDFYEYEALLLHRQDMERELEIAGRADLFACADALDAWFDGLTVEVADSPFAAGSGKGSTSDARRTGRWWTRLPADEESRSYTMIGNT